MDWKSIGLCPQGFKSPRCRFATVRQDNNRLGRHCCQADNPKNASAGNRARDTSMATMYSATRPLMLLGPLMAGLNWLRLPTLGAAAVATQYPRWDLNPQSPPWEGGALSIRPHGLVTQIYSPNTRRATKAWPTPCGTRTHNLRIRSPTPCPLGQGGC